MTHDKSKPRHDELNISPKQLKVGDKVLLEVADPRIATSEPNGAIPLTLIAGMRSINSSHHHDHATERFSNPYGRAHRCALGRAHTMRGDTTVRYCRVKTEQKCFPNTGSAKLPRPHDMGVGNPAKLKRACGTTVPIDRGRACQNNMSVRLHTRAWEKQTKNDTAVQHGRVHQCVQFQKPRNARAEMRAHGRAHGHDLWTNEPLPSPEYPPPLSSLSWPIILYNSNSRSSFII
ncbi:hypothetical protein GOBAR_AA06003 [Gossypium barbadense]|uniref:Uncharacterized protein n=1 Tax=Gossypium barbadense TaxID=3634 RepID=A0A2P5YG60_GOSBA|nr:hypothetical protein GOBAR_AA06003 [Gossypium barbadense]